MTNSIHPKLALLDAAVEALTFAARETGLQFARFSPDRQKKSYRALQPGPDTPLWNELRKRVAVQLRKHGEQTLLARFLGISRQRLNLMIKANTAAPDAERTLLLLAWVIAKENGKELQ